MIIHHFYLLTLFLLHSSFGNEQEDPCLSLVFTQNQIVINGVGSFSNPKIFISKLFFHADYLIIDNYQHVHKPLSVPFVSLRMAAYDQSPWLDLASLFDSMAVLGSFAFWRADWKYEGLQPAPRSHDEISDKIVTGAFYDFQGPLLIAKKSSEHAFPQGGIVIAKPIAQKGLSCTLDVGFYESNSHKDSPSPISSCKFIMVFIKKSLNDDLQEEEKFRTILPHTTKSLPQGSEFKRIKSEFDFFLKEGQVILESSIDHFVYNLYGSVFGGFLMRIAHERATNEIGETLALKKGIFYHAISKEILELQIKIRKMPHLEGKSFLVTFENENCVFCGFLFENTQWERN